MNRLGQRGETDLGWNSAAYAARARAFGWHAIELDGHDLAAIDARLRRGAGARRTSRPASIAKTEKGHGVSFLANKDGWHGKALNAEQAKKAIAELGGERHIIVTTSEARGPAAGRRRRRAAAEAARPTSSAPRRRRARPTATPWWRVGAAPAGRGRAGRRGVQLDPRRRVQEGLSRTASSRCSSPSSSWSRRRRRLRRAAARGPSPRPSPPSSPAPTTRSAWRPSPTPPSTCAARTPASASARTARRRWRWKTWR